MKCESKEGPLVSFIVLAYNQEKYIAQAVEGAFAQIYSPLEIVISDDCSTDRTFAVMQEMTARYKGPHKVVLNRNPKNLGIGAHVNRVVELSAGELIVGGAGDDYSLPERTMRTFQTWASGDFKSTSIFSGYQAISEDGKDLWTRSNRQPDLSRLPDRVRAWNVAAGCAHAFTKRVFREFGPLSNDVAAEDSAINFRSWSLHPVAFIDEPLVCYRIHDGAVSSLSLRDSPPEVMQTKYVRMWWSRVATYKQYLRDMDCEAIAGAVAPEALGAAREYVLDELRLAHFQWRFAQAGRAERFRMLKDHTVSGVRLKRLPAWLLRAAFPRLDIANIRRLTRTPDRKQLSGTAAPPTTADSQACIARKRAEPG